MNEARGYSSFVMRYAPLGYAHLYVRLRDFHAAQQALVETVEHGHGRWEQFRLSDPSIKGAQIMARLVNGAPTRGPVAPSSEGEISSFSRSRKLAALQDSVRLLDLFSAEEQVLLVLLYVEEIAEDRVSKWLGVEAAELAALKELTVRRVNEAKLQTSPGESGMDFFRRALRQYRLSAQFLERMKICSMSTASNGPPFYRSIAFWALFLLPGVLFVTVLSGAYNHSWDRYGGGGGDWAINPVSLIVLFLDTVLLMSAILMSYHINHRVPRARSNGQFVVAGVALSLLSAFGVVVLLVQFLWSFTPWTFRSDNDFGLICIVMHNLWMIATIVVVMSGGYLLFTSDLKHRGPVQGGSQ